VGFHLILPGFVSRISRPLYNIAVVFAIQLVILLVGLLQDTIIAFLKRMACPYTIFTTGGK